MTKEEARNEIDYLINDGVVTEKIIVPLEQRSIDALKVAKEALQERPKAQWIGLDSRYCKCSNCGILADFNLAEYYSVCPQCEAEMWNGGKQW